MPGPPSARGIIVNSASARARRTPSAIAAAASEAVRVPLYSCGAMTMRIRAPFWHSGEGATPLLWVECHLVLTTRTLVLRIVAQTFYLVSGGRYADDVENPTGDPAPAAAVPAAAVPRLWRPACPRRGLRDVPGVRVFALRDVARSN